MTQYGLWVFYYFRAPVSHSFPFGNPWPIFLILHFHELLLTLLDFLGPITLSFILGAHGFSINPLPFFACITSGLLWPILTFLHHTAHGFATSLSPGFFRPICFLKAHLFILWACDPIFLPFGLNGFSIHLLALLCPCCWASFYWASQNERQH